MGVIKVVEVDTSAVDPLELDGHELVAPCAFGGEWKMREQLICSIVAS